MKEALKTVEVLVELVYQELNRVKATGGVADRSYAILREASVDAINLKRKIQEARGWMTHEEKANKT